MGLALIVPLKAAPEYVGHQCRRVTVVTRIVLAVVEVTRARQLQGRAGATLDEGCIEPPCAKNGRRESEVVRLETHQLGLRAPVVHPDAAA